MRTRAKKCRISSSNPWPPTSCQPAWTAARRAPGHSHRSTRDSRASNPTSAPDWTASPAATEPQHPTERSSLARSRSALPCGDLGRLKELLASVYLIFNSILYYNCDNFKKKDEKLKSISTFIDASGASWHIPDRSLSTFKYAILFGVSKMRVVDNTFVKPQGLLCMRVAQ